MMTRVLRNQQLSGRLSFGLAFFYLAVLPAVAQTSNERSGNTLAEKTLVNQIYEKTKSAKTLAEFTEVIRLCDGARANKLGSGTVAYLNRLASWAHNKRGESYADQAAALMEGGEVKRAEELDELALADFKSSVRLDGQRWKALHNRGVSYAMIGKYEEAVVDFTAVIELNAKYSNAWFNRGEILYELGEYGKAINDYDRVIQLSPKDAGAYTSRGHAFYQLRHFDKAIRDYNETIALAPNNADAYTNRGDAYRSLGEWDKSAEDYRRAVSVEKNSGRAYQSAAWLMATCPDERFRNRELAVQAAQKAIVLDGANDYKYLDTLAAAFANAGDFNEAKSNLAKAIQIAPDGEVPVLRKRYKLYEEKRAYRQELRTAARPLEATEKR